MWWNGNSSWMFSTRTGQGFKGVDKYSAGGRIGSVKDGKSWRRATAKRRKKRK